MSDQIVQLVGNEVTDALNLHIREQVTIHGGGSGIPGPHPPVRPWRDLRRR
jgi:hypothetical protein